MKSFGSSLLTYLRSDATTELIVKDLFTITLSSGRVITATNGQLDIGTGGTIYFSSLNGLWSRDTVTTDIGTNSNSTNITVLIQADNPPMLPGTAIPLLGAINGGFFDGAQILIQTAYMPTYGDTSFGLETKFLGTMGEISKATSVSCEFSVHDLLYLLNVQMPKNLVHSGCGNTLYDARCGLSPSSFSESFTVATGGNNLQINLSAASIPGAGDANYYTKGYMKFTSGLNAGLHRMIRQQASTTQMLLSKPFLFPVSYGDSITIFAGCDQTTATCSNRFGNLIRFSGAPFVPSPESVL